MYKYFATFSPGFEEYIVKALEENLKDGEVISSQESSVTFKSSLPYEKVEKLRYLANVYLLVGSPVHSNVPDTAFVKLLNNNADYAIPQKHPHPTKLKTFRVMVQKGNQLIGITKAVTDKIKEKIEEQSHLKHSPLKAELEYWFILRDDGYGYIGAKYMNNQPAPEKGELRPHLANALILASEPKAEDIFMDPFSGNGSIPFERVFSYPYKKVIAVDNSHEHIQKVIKKTSRFPNTAYETADSTNLKHVKDASIDVIVTDPPWGIYNGKTMQDMTPFYEKMLQEMSRILNADGRIVILTAKKEELTNALFNTRTLLTQKTFSTLVNGKKAGVFILSKTA